jgi:hypothetical protein
MYARTITPAGTQRGDLRPARRYSPTERILSPDNTSWQRRALAEHAHSTDDRRDALRSDLALRVAALTEQPVAPATIYVDDAARFAIVNVDGAVFRLQDRDLTLLRPCVHCGTGQYASTPLATLADLGYALGEWDPHCPHCEPVDPANWLDEI